MGFFSAVGDIIGGVQETVKTIKGAKNIIDGVSSILSPAPGGQQLGSVVAGKPHYRFNRGAIGLGEGVGLKSSTGETLTAASTDSVVELESDGSRIRKLDKTQQSNAYIRIKKLELEQLHKMITQYKLSSTAPLQVAGDDSIEGVYSRTTEFNRIKYQ